MPQYHVCLSYSTFADSPEEALDLALGAAATRSGPYVEIEQDGVRDAVSEGPLEDYSHSDDCPANDGFGCRCGEAA